MADRNRMSEKVRQKLKHGYVLKLLSQTARVYSFEVVAGNEEYTVRFEDGEWGPEYPYSWEVEGPSRKIVGPELKKALVGFWFCIKHSPELQKQIEKAEQQSTSP